MKRLAVGMLGILVLGAIAVGGGGKLVTWMGKQPDGSYLVSSGQRVEGDGLAFRGRPMDLALHPSGDVFAVLNQREVFLARTDGLIKDSASPLPLNAKAGYRGLVWSPDGKRLFASTDKIHIQSFVYEKGSLRPERQIAIRPSNDKDHPVPGGMVITRDGKTLFVAACNRNAIVEIDLEKNERVRELPVQLLPFEPRLSENEQTLIVSNWGGRPPQAGDRIAKTQFVEIVVDERGAPASGTVTLIDRRTGQARHVEVGLHPTSLTVAGGQVFVANALSDSISVIDLDAAKVVRTIPIRWGKLKVFGSMPNALAVRGDRLYVCNGGDNALCEIDVPSGQVHGFRHAGYYPVALALTQDQKALVLNTKGNGSVANTSLGKPGSPHDFEGTVSVIDLTKNLEVETAVVARNNHWSTEHGRPKLKVYNGAVKHVLYIIKENLTYDMVFGDLPVGNGDPKLCCLGETVMPNHRALARQFTLFDNGYVSGTNSADGHAWCTQCLANDYLEHFYDGYSRTYPDDGDCAMSISSAGCLWDAAAKKKLSIRVWGEFCDDKLAKIEPQPKDWFEVWEDYKKGTKKFKMTADTRVAGLRPYINTEVHYWPLLQSDQFRADKFLEEFQKFSQADQVPQLMILTLPCDHSEGVDPKYPTPRAMMADNDLALGRVIEAVSKSPQWKDTCVFVVEDDGQWAPDHVDGHRTVYMVLSPYVKRQHVDSTFYTQTNMFKSMELMLGIDPMNKFDATAAPITTCFTDTLDLTPYQARSNNIALDERNPQGEQMTQADRYWLEKNQELDWSHLDAPDPYWLNRIIWYSLYHETLPYPARPGEAPREAGIAAEDD
jgi:YVTN family beta-propeller protein